MLKSNQKQAIVYDAQLEEEAEMLKCPIDEQKKMKRTRNDEIDLGKRWIVGLLLKVNILGKIT